MNSAKSLPASQEGSHRFCLSVRSHDSCAVAASTAASISAVRAADTPLPVNTPRQLAMVASSPCSRNAGSPNTLRREDTPMARSLPEAMASLNSL
ncbi:hypothetical protein D3C71_1906450 [compost metagenome]